MIEINVWQARYWYTPGSEQWKVTAQNRHSLHFWGTIIELLKLRGKVLKMMGVLLT